MKIIDNSSVLLYFTMKENDRGLITLTRVPRIFLSYFCIIILKMLYIFFSSSHIFVVRCRSLDQPPCSAWIIIAVPERVIKVQAI